MAVYYLNMTLYKSVHGIYLSSFKSILKYLGRFAREYTTVKIAVRKINQLFILVIFFTLFHYALC